MASPNSVSDEPRQPSGDELLSLDLDARLVWLWREIWESADVDLDIVGAYIRYAYGRGYEDALTEDQRGQLYADHGYPVPHRRPNPPSDTSSTSDNTSDKW